MLTKLQLRMLFLVKFAWHHLKQQPYDDANLERFQVIHSRDNASIPLIFYAFFLQNESVLLQNALKLRSSEIPHKNAATVGQTTCHNDVLSAQSAKFYKTWSMSRP